MYTRYENCNGLTWMVNEDATYKDKKVCRVVFLGTKQNPAFEESIYSSFEDFCKMFMPSELKKIED